MTKQRYKHVSTPFRLVRVSHRRFEDMPEEFSSVKELALYLGISVSTAFSWISRDDKSDTSFERKYEPMPVETELVDVNMHYKIKREPLRAWLIKTGRYVPRKPKLEYS
jgi:hypothetical protein